MFFLKNKVKKKIKGNRNHIDISKNITVNKKVTISITGNDNTVIIDDSLFVKKTLNITIKGDNNRIILGKNIKVIDNLNIQILEDCCNGEIVIGDNCSFWSTLIQTCELCSKILIGEDCMFSYNTTVMNSDGHCIFQDDRLINIGKEIKINNHCWIGYNAMVYKNSFIAENSIVGRNAFVSGKFKTGNVVLAGLPARIIKENINWSRETVNEGVYKYKTAETLVALERERERERESNLSNS